MKDEGIGPENSLFVRLNFSKFDKSPIFVGITPVKRLLFKFNEVKKDNRPNDDGIVPLR